jgi:hypothetical protein
MQREAMHEPSADTISGSVPVSIALVAIVAAASSLLPIDVVLMSISDGSGACTALFSSDMFS